MSNLPEHAWPTQIASIDDSLVGRKLVLVGRMMSYDSTTGFILLWDKNNALLVDVALCIDRTADVWLQDRLCSIEVFGHLEKCSKRMSIPALPPHLVTKPKIDDQFVLRAIKVIRVSDIEQNTWNSLAERVRLHTESELKKIRPDLG